MHVATHFKNFISRLQDDKTVLHLLCILGIAVFGIMLTGDFIWDDKGLVLYNEQIKSFSHFADWFTTSATAGSGQISNIYRPLPTMINAILYLLLGATPSVYHALNIALHILNAYLVFRLFTLLKFHRTGAMFASILFLVHPVQVESVSYIAGLPDVLSASFILLALIEFLSPSPFVVHRLKLLGFTVLALLSKEIGVVILPLAVILTIYRGENLTSSERKIQVKDLMALGVAVAVYITLKMTVLDFTDSNGLSYYDNIYTQNLDVRIYTFFASIWEYSKVILLPAVLQFEKPFLAYASITGKVVAGATILFGALGAGIYSYFKNRKFFLGAGWFFASLFPVSGIIIAVNATYYEHWLYIPLIGILCAIAFFWEKIKSPSAQKNFVICASLIAVIFSGRSFARNLEWVDTHAFFDAELEKNQNSDRLYNQAGQLYFDEKNYTKAQELFEKGIEIDTDVLLPELRYNLGSAYLAQKKLEPAVDMYFRALEINPSMREALVALFNISIAVHDDARTAEFKKLVDRVDAGGTVSFDEIKALSY